MNAAATFAKLPSGALSMLSRKEMARAWAFGASLPRSSVTAVPLVQALRERETLLPEQRVPPSAASEPADLGFNQNRSRV